MHIAIIGATGLVGSKLLKKLLENNEVKKITAITRKEIAGNPGKLNQILFNDMNVFNIEALEFNADIFFCGLGTTIKTAGGKEAFYRVDHDLVLAFAKLSKKSQAKALIVVSAMGARKDSKIFYNRVKGEMEEDIKELSLNSTYFLRPSLLIGDREEKRVGEEIAIAFYKVATKVLPSNISQKMGTKVSDIVDYVEREIFDPKSGLHIISNFL